MDQVLLKMKKAGYMIKLLVFFSFLVLWMRQVVAVVVPDSTDPTVLVAYVDANDTETYSEKISRSYTKFVKKGKGTLVLTAASSEKSATDFIGAVEVKEGILQLDNFYAIRQCSYISDTSQYRVSVSSNAQILVKFDAKGSSMNAIYNLAIEGDGPDGRGALVFDGGGNGTSLVRVLHLTGDASIGGTGKFGVGYWGRIYFNGHTLTGMNNEYMMVGVKVPDDSQAGNFRKLGGNVTMQSDSTAALQLCGSAENSFTLSNAVLSCANVPELDSKWTLRPQFGSTLNIKKNARWCGPIVGDGTGFTVRNDSDNTDLICDLYGSITNVGIFGIGQYYKDFTLNLIDADHWFTGLNCLHGNVVITGGQYHAVGRMYVNKGDDSRAAYLAFKDAGTVVDSGESRICAGAANVPAHLEINGKTVICGQSGSRWMIGDHSTESWAAEYPRYWGKLSILDGAVVTNAIHVGYRGLGGVNQDSSTVFLNGGLCIGYGKGSKNAAEAYGCWSASDSTFAITGNMSIGHSPVATGFWVQRGGMAENKQENTAGYLYLGREGGNAFVYVGNGGKFRFPNVNVVGFGGPGSNGGSGVITVDGVDSLVDFGTRPVCWMWHTNYTTHININNGGKFRAYRFQYEALRSRLENSRSYLSFDGGELSFARQKAETKEYAAFMTWYTNGGIPCESHPDLCTVFAGGAVIRVEDDFTVHWEADLLKPSGKSVTAIALPSDESFYAATHLGALRVVIEDSAGGEGASAFVDYDCKTRLPSKIIVTSPGVNYSPETVTAKVKSMRGDVEWDCAVTLGEIVGGGLEKAGPGLLTLKGTSTYSGRTKVSGGRLAICREAFPQNQPLELAGGTLVMSSYDLSVSDISGYGSVISQESVTRMHIGGKMVISAEDAIDGSMLEFVKVKPVFEEGASIEISGTLPDMDGECRCVLAKFSHPFEGDPVLKNTRDGWKMYLSGDRKSLKLRRLCGFTMIVR